jgi:hypothetical protein
MTALFIAIMAGSIAAWWAIALSTAMSRTRPDVLLAIARPSDTPEHIESELTADLLAGRVEADHYRRALAQLAAADRTLVVSR